MDKGKQIAASSRLEGNYLRRIFSRRRDEDEEVRVENLIDLDDHIERFRQNKLDLINPNVIYKRGNIFSKYLLYQHYSERYVSCTHEDQMVKLDLTEKNSYKQINDRNLKHAHLGLIIIGVKGLHRENLGTKTLICHLFI